MLALILLTLYEYTFLIIFLNVVQKGETRCVS